jgi:hypothetical protein
VQPDSGVTLLHFRSALPATDWLRSAILWADDLAAIWPAGGPDPRNSTQEQSAREVAALQGANLFWPQFIPDWVPDHISLADALNEFGQIGSDQPVTEEWQDGQPAVGLPSMPSRTRPQDGDRFLYPDKLPKAIQEELIRRGVIAPRADGFGYSVKSGEVLDRLLAACACVLYESSGGRLVPDVGEPVEGRRLAAPSEEGQSRDAITLELRGLGVPNLRTEFDRFIEFRLNEGNERARRDYIQQLTGLWRLCSDGGPQHALDESVRRATRDLQRAQQSYVDQLGTQALVTQGMTSLASMLPLAVGQSVLAIVVALTNVGASAVSLSVRKGAPKYVRRVGRAGLLATTDPKS